MTFPAEQQGDLPFTPELMGEILRRTADAPGADYRVLSYVITGTPLGHTLRKTFKEIAQDLKISAPSVGKSVQRLVDAGWLEFSYSMGRVSFYRAGPNVTTLARMYTPDEREADDVTAQELAPILSLPNRAEHGTD